MAAAGEAAEPSPQPPPSTGRPRGRPRKVVTESVSTSSAPTPTTYTSGSEYATPLTSYVATPTPSLPAEAPKQSSLKRPARIEVILPTTKASSSRQKQLRQGPYAMNSKRKRDVIQDSEDEDSDTSPDAILARQLQEEENQAAAQELEPLPDASSSRTLRARPSYSPRRTRTTSGRQGRAFVPQARGSKRTKVEDQPSSIADSQEDDDSLSDPPESGDSDSSAAPLSRQKRTSTRPSVMVSATPAPATVSNKKKGKSIAVVPDSEESDLESLPDDYQEDDYDSVASIDTGRRDGFIDIGSDFASDDDDDDDDDDFDTAQAPARPLAVPSTAIQAAVANRRAYRLPQSGRRAKRNRDRLEKNHPELKTMWDDLEKMPVLKAGKAEQPQSISRQLKPFQLEGLAWMKEMEKLEWKGGLLGDEMGLGKTIQAVSLIMSDWPAKKPSLVLVPPVALMQWMTEIESYTDGTLKTLVVHGTNSKSKNLTVKDIKQYDVIIMSYNSLESMFRKQEKGFKRKDGLFKEKSVIHQTEFHRVILDEAHSIKTRTTMTAKACFALKVTYRWCLTGTPLQNRIGEFFSLIRFLNIRPFACYLCKTCPCSQLEWNMDANNRCKGCKHGGMQHVSVFNQELLNPIQRYGNTGLGAVAFKKLRVMTDRIMLRRLKKDHTNAMELPAKEIDVTRQFFGEEENDFANSIMTSGQRKFDTYVASGVLLNNYANIFGLIMQMRQVADHPDLILKKNSEGGQNVLVCSICDETAEDAIRSRCKHDFCRLCAKSYLNSTQEPNCPQCHIPLSIDLEQPEMEQDEASVKKSSIINRIKMENWTSSSKIELLVHELHKLRSDNASHKSIIFSQFTTMLQLIEWRLRRAGITTVMLDGSMTPAQRQASIEYFMKNAHVECFLVSMKAGGVALNLTEASRVFIVDPWWNPAAEWQGGDRIHRIGQNRPCTITRLCIEDSVESRMVLLQEKKTNMINSTINSDDAAMDSLTPEDLQFLFRGS